MSQPLQQIDSNIWMADGPEVSFFGFGYPTRMVVARLAEGLWVWSPIELTAELKRAVDGLGRVRWITTPNRLHHLFVPGWLEVYEEAVALAPPGLAEKRDDIAFAATLGEEPVAEWTPDIEHVIVHGSVMEEVLFFHRPSSTCIVGDLIQRHEPSSFTGWKAAVMKLDGMVGDGGSTPREWRATFLNREGARAALKAALEWNPRRLVIAHGTCAMEDGVDVLRNNLDWMTKPWPV